MTLPRSNTRNRRFTLAMRQQTTACAVIAALSITAAAGSHRGEAPGTTPQFAPFEFRNDPAILPAATVVATEPASWPTGVMQHAVQGSVGLAVPGDLWHGWSRSIGSTIGWLGNVSMRRLAMLWELASAHTPVISTTIAEPIGFYIESARASWESGDADSLLARDSQPLTLRVNHRGGWNEPIRTRIVATAASVPAGAEMAVSLILQNQEHVSVEVEARDWVANRFIPAAEHGSFSGGDRLIRADGRVELRILFDTAVGIVSEADMLVIDQVRIEFIPSPGF